MRLTIQLSWISASRHRFAWRPRFAAVDVSCSDLGARLLDGFSINTTRPWLQNQGEQSHKHATAKSSHWQPQPRRKSTAQTQKKPRRPRRSDNARSARRRNARRGSLIGKRPAKRKKPPKRTASNDVAAFEQRHGTTQPAKGRWTGWVDSSSGADVCSAPFELYRFSAGGRAYHAKLQKFSQRLWTLSGRFRFAKTPLGVYRSSEKML